MVTSVSELTPCTSCASGKRAGEGGQARVNGRVGWVVRDREDGVDDVQDAAVKHEILRLWVRHRLPTSRACHLSSGFPGSMNGRGQGRVTYGSHHHRLLLVAAKEQGCVVNLGELDFLSSGNVRKWLAERCRGELRLVNKVACDGLSHDDMILKYPGEQVRVVH